ncbi:Segregation and condensation protein A [Sebaldella termitidis]|uniref:Segregation and condensation protein A n=2 Tax=Sebaldella TaxID=32068 RepID=D1AKC8_SEBTE|nr:segregation/condensation protein A [Sebaldella termitidis]ACZ09044.1 chromosome segregation and condensation protein ScpA [Sebaldella termitidis ATCC 33386]SUI24362.1 Segregation and condensation protein A [Sebaldella termitidis]
MSMAIQIKLENFEGPLDLLIHLVEKNKMDITKIDIFQIIEDYLMYIKEAQELNLKVKVEFLVMATELIEIKAYSILNKGKKEEREEDLEKRIIEYKLFKEISEKMAEYENEYNIAYKRSGLQSVVPSEIEYDLSALSINNLFSHFKNLLKEEVKITIKVELEEEYTIEEAYKEVYEMINTKERVNFNMLLKNKYTRLRIVSLFLCILDLFKDGVIDIQFEENEFYVMRLNYV